MLQLTEKPAPLPLNVLRAIAALLTRLAQGLDRNIPAQGLYRRRLGLNACKARPDVYTTYFAL